jgi:hypothetical protein
MKFSYSEISYVPVKRAIDIRNRPRIPIPDEDPYSVAGSGGSSGSSGVGTGTTGTGNGTGMVAATREQLLQQQQQLLQRRSDKPPKLPPRDNNYPHDIPKVSKSNRMMTIVTDLRLTFEPHFLVVSNRTFCI